MASPAWLEIFGEYSDEELAKQIKDLREQVNAFTSQASGSKTYTKDISALEAQLSAATRIKKQRDGRATPPAGIMDFSRLKV